MSTRKVEGEGYSVEYNKGTQRVVFAGSIRLQTTAEYEPVKSLLTEAYDTAAAAGSPLTLDFRQLQFLNSSGINTVSRFVIAARKQDKTTLIVLGSADIYWQKKSLTNLQKLWSKVQIQIQ
jgi:hypothetical protein